MRGRMRVPVRSGTIRMSRIKVQSHHVPEMLTFVAPELLGAHAALSREARMIMHDLIQAHGNAVSIQCEPCFLLADWTSCSLLRPHY